jgi:F0F1-type ATP synthase beta subunit
MNEPPGARARVALSGLSMLNIRDGAGTDQGKMYCSSLIISSVLLKQVLRFALLGRMPSAVGYQPTLATEMGAMQSVSSTKRIYYICTSGLRTCG